MIKHRAAVDFGSCAVLKVALNKVTQMSDGFSVLTRFISDEILGRDIAEIFPLLRISPDTAAQTNAPGGAVCYLFTKELEPREVAISRSKEQSGDEIYMFEEKNDSRLEKLLGYPCQLLDENVLGVAIYSASDFLLLKANQRYLSFCDPIFGQPENMIGRTLDQFVEGYRGSPAEEAVNQIFVTGKSAILKELQFDDAKRGPTYWDQIITPITADGRIKYVVATAQDVTERVLTRKQYDLQNMLLEQKKTELTTIIENMTDALVIFDENGLFKTINKSARELFLPMAPELRKIGDGLLVSQYYDGQGRLLSNEENPTRRVRNGETLVNERICIKQGATILYVDVNGTPIYDEMGRFSTGIMSCRDVTAQVGNEKQYAFLVESMQSGVVHQSRDGTIIAMNRAAEQILGKGPDEFLGSSSIQVEHHTIQENGALFPGEEHPAMLALRTGEPNQDTIMGVYNPIRKAYRWININAVPMFRPGDSKPYQVFTIFDDITDHKKAEDALKKSEMLFRSVLDNSSDLTYCYNLQENAYEFTSRACEKILGFTQEEMMSMDLEAVHAMTHPDDRKVFGEYLDKLLEENGTAEIQYRQRTKSGKYRWLVNHLYLVCDETGRPLYRSGTIQDITERKQMEDALRESEVRLRSVLENSSDIIYSQNMLTNRYEYVSPASKTVLGYTPDEFMAIDEETTRAMIHPDDLSAFLDSFKDLDEKGVQELKYRQRTKSGDYRWFSNRLSVVKDEAGRVLYRFGNIHDITEQVENDAVIRYQANLLQNISNMVISTDENLLIKSWNKAAELKYGWTEAETLGHNVRQLLQAEVLGAPFEEKYCQLLEHGKVEFEVTHTCRDGSKINAINTLVLLKNNEGKMIGTVGIFHDVTERRKMENALRESEARLRFVLENSSDVIYSLNVQTNVYDYISPAYEKVMGYTLEDIMTNDRERILAQIHPDDLPGLLAALEELDDNEAELHYRQKVKSGEYRWVSNRLSLVRDEAGHVLYQNGIMHDITEQVKNEAVIRYQANLLQNVTDMIISGDENFLIKSWNKRAELTYGWTEEEAIGKNINEFLKVESLLSSLEEDTNKLFEDGRIDVDHIHSCKDGRKIYVNSRVQIVKDAQGRYMGTVGIIRDITAQKKMEDALRQSELHLRLAAEGAELGTYTYDFLNDKVFLTGELEMQRGQQIYEPVVQNLDALFVGLHPDDQQRFLEVMRAGADPSGDGVIKIDYRAVKPDGTIKWMHARGQTTFSDSGGHRHPVFSAGAVIDITKRVEAENSMREISEELRNIIESTEDFIWSVDKDYKLVLYNSSFEHYIWSKFRHHLKKGLSMKEILTPQSGALWEDLYERTVADGKFQVEMKIDRASRIMSYSFNPVYINAELVEITVFGKDITERLNSEREIIHLNASLEKRVSERTEELQKSVTNLQNLSQIISHDLKEPIREIEAYASQLDINADVALNAHNIKRTCMSMTHMIEDLSKYAMSSQHKLHIETVNVKKKVISIYNDLKSGITNRSILQFESGLPLVSADKVLLRQALYNLLSNAIKFSGKKELIEITVGCAEENGQYVFHIRDNGAGFDMKYAHKLFNIFERLHTDEEFEGSGIGLAAVRNIIQRHGGRVWIESEEDAGTIVFFTLPAHNEN